MTQVSDNVRVAVTGAVSVGALGATAPTSAESVLAEHDDLGYVSEDGVTETRDRTTNPIRAWQNGDTVREVVTEANLTYTFTMLETREATVETYYGTSVVGGAIVIVPAKTGGRRSYVIDVIDDDEFIRTYIPEGEVVEVGEQVYANGEAVGYQVTVRGYPSADIQDADGNNGSAKKWYSSLTS